MRQNFEIHCEEITNSLAVRSVKQNPTDLLSFIFFLVFICSKATIEHTEQLGSASVHIIFTENLKKHSKSNF